MRLVVITAPTSTPHEANLCNRMNQAGLRQIHLRKPEWNTQQARDFLCSLDDSTVQSVVLHNWHELTAEFPVKVSGSLLRFRCLHCTGSAMACCELGFCGKAVSMSVQGIHYTEKTRPSTALQPRDRLTISTAFHSLHQVHCDYGALNYAFLSPIFNSISKAGYQAAFDLDELAEALQKSHVPLIALGGQYVG